MEPCRTVEKGKSSTLPESATIQDPPWLTVPDKTLK
jgi:hypothetical protein